MAIRRSWSSGFCTRTDTVAPKGLLGAEVERRSRCSPRGIRRRECRRQISRRSDQATWRFLRSYELISLLYRAVFSLP